MAVDFSATGSRSHSTQASWHRDRLRARRAELAAIAAAEQVPPGGPSVCPVGPGPEQGSDHPAAASVTDTSVEDVSERPARPEQSQAQEALQAPEGQHQDPDLSRGRSVAEKVIDLAPDPVRRRGGRQR